MRLHGPAGMCITGRADNSRQQSRRLETCRIQKGRVASPVPPLAPHARLAPVTRLAGSLRRRLGSGGLTVWLLKAAVRHASARKARARNSHDPDAWRRAWRDGDGKHWPAEPVTGIIEFPNGKLVVDRCEMTAAGHLWLDGWALGQDAASFKLEAAGCAIERQATFATARPDVVQAMQLSLVGREANVGVQVMARIAEFVPSRSRLALVGDATGPGIVVPVVPHIERSGSMWHAVYDAMRHRGQRDLAYLETSVGMLKDLRKLDWRERNAAICRSIDETMSQSSALKVLVLSRLHPNVAYLNLNLLAAARSRPAEFIVCSMGQAAIQRANEYRAQLSTIGDHTVGFVSAEAGTPSSELIEQFALSCRRRGSPGLIVYDDVAVSGAMSSLAEALGGETVPTTAWPRQFPLGGEASLPFAEPLAENDGPGPYWRSARAMEHGLGALLFNPGDIEVPSIPPFEGRGYGLEFLLKSALPDARVSKEAMLDLVEPASQREPQKLDLLMLLATGREA